MIKNVHFLQKKKRLPLSYTVSIIVITILFFSCVTAEDRQGFQYEEQFEPITKQQAEKNYLLFHGVELSLPNTWTFLPAKPNREEAILFHVTDDERNAFGSCEVLDIQSMGIAQEQAISLLTNTRNGNNTLIDSFIIRERASPLYVVMAVNGSDSPATLILRLFFFESTRAYVLEFTLGNKPAKVKELIDYIGTSFTYHDTPHSIRLRSDSLVFIGTSSSFNWFSDIENGLILSGQVLETPSFLQVKRDDEKSGTSINAIDKNNVIDTNPLFFMVNNRRVWPIVQSPEIGTHLAIYKAEFALPIEESSVSYTISCTIPSQSTQIDRTIIFQSEAVQTLLKRELFFPVYQDNNDAGGEGDR